VVWTAEERRGERVGTAVTVTVLWLRDAKLMRVVWKAGLPKRDGRGFMEYAIYQEDRSDR